MMDLLIETLISEFLDCEKLPAAQCSRHGPQAGNHFTLFVLSIQIVITCSKMFGAVRLLFQFCLATFCDDHELSHLS